MGRVAAGLVLILVGGLAARAARADGAVYAMTNAPRNNEVVVFDRARDGTLTFAERIATRGCGSGIQLDPTDSLGSQGGLVLDRRHRRLFAVNTESSVQDPRDGLDVGDCQVGTISSFRVARNGSLTLVDQIPSGGLFPASLTVHERLLYVLNAGGPGLGPSCGVGPNVTGFETRPTGHGAGAC
jgi:6-phosphogluconolactonase (cycloisomerase 2 family)